MHNERARMPPKKLPEPPAEYLSRYDAMCDRAAAQVIASYSSSFTLATRLLTGGTKRDIRNLYAMVRIADEIVDGTAIAADVAPAAALDAYEAAVLAAPDVRFHTDPVLHAYGGSARRCGFSSEHVRAFFASMRRDALSQHTYSDQEFAEYVYGSAEVIGLMCVCVFVANDPAGAGLSDTQREKLDAGARALGSALQKINFLRDYGEDRNVLGRTYFPQTVGTKLDDATKATLISDIRAELDLAQLAIPLLPGSAQRGVAAAEALFRELTVLLEHTPADQLAGTRISLPTIRKLAVTARAVARKGSYGS